MSEKSVVVRNYGLLAPTNWGRDCFEHLFLQNKLWNRLVEIEQENRSAYRAVVGTDENASEINAQISEAKNRLADMDVQRKEIRKDKRAKQSIHTEPLDEAIKTAKAELKALSSQAKEIRAAAKDRIKATSTQLSDLEQQRKDNVKTAYQTSGLWWGNYNAVCNSYDVARSKAMKEGAELKFHRFDGSGRFTCQIQGGVSTEDLLSSRHSVAQIRLVDNGTFAEAIKSNPPSLLLQEVGSRRDSRQYGILSITAYTERDENGKHSRRMLDFPIILHRPLPKNATLKELCVKRRKVGTDYVWSVTFTFRADIAPVKHPAGLFCGINIGWKQVNGGLRIATIHGSNGKTSHIVLPKDVVDRLEYVDSDLKSRIDTATNDNFVWMLNKLQGDDLPEQLVEVRSMLRRSKRPHPDKFAKAVIVWREHCPNYLPIECQEAEKRRKSVKRLTLEHAHLRDKVLRRRLDFYRVEAGKIAAKYRRIVLDKIDLRKMAALENEDGSVTDLHEKARRMRTIAAVSEFREWLVKQSAKTGSVVDQVAIVSTHTCSACGGAMEPSDALTIQCRDCGIAIDRDENASLNLCQMAA